jgi:DeoR/GlpR family transcriptional regulator of sugar metabolism
LPVEIYGVQEVAELFGVTEETVRRRRQLPDFPEPTRLACGVVWTRDQLVEYARLRAEKFKERPAIVELAAASPTRYDPFAHAETRQE